MLPEIEKIQKTQVNQNTRFQQIQQKLSNSLVGKFTNMVSLKINIYYVFMLNFYSAGSEKIQGWYT